MIGAVVLGSCSPGPSPSDAPARPEIPFLPMHRLNRAEYNNTVRDLLGDETHPANSFPADNIAVVFDNDSSVLTLSPSLFEHYETAAEALVDGLIDPPTATPARSRILSCDPTVTPHEACVRQILTDFASRAYRRPVTSTEVDVLIALVTAEEVAGQPFAEAIKAGLIAVLVNPNFLFRPELDDSPDDTHAVTPYELASRLSYFLWSTMPDEELLAAAQGGTLASPDILAAQARRMLDDPKSSAFVENFGSQWLYYRLLKNWVPSSVEFPTFDVSLLDAMYRETTLVFDEFVHGDRPIEGLLTADFTYVNEPLARFYGIAGVTGEGMQRVTMQGPHRLGVLSHAGVLTVTSLPDQTSIPRRGRLVLSELLCLSPPDPPIGVPPLPGNNAQMPTTQRQLFEQHDTNPACASCHQLMDPIGFAFEHFNAIGAYREADKNRIAIDASGRLPDGTMFRDNVELSSALAARPELPACVTRHLLSYAVGRHFTDDDRDTIDRVRTSSPTSRIKDLIVAVVLDRAFGRRTRSP